MENGRSGEERRVGKLSTEQKKASGEVKEDEEVWKKQGGNRTGGVTQACYHASPMAVNPR